jgi:hypothetical protein
MHPPVATLGIGRITKIKCVLPAAAHALLAGLDLSESRPSCREGDQMRLNGALLSEEGWPGAARGLAKADK